MTRNTNPTAKTVQLVWDRDGGCAKCGAGLYGVRGVQWHLHHRRPRSMGGSKGHRDVESHRDQARADGFLVSANGVRKPVDSPLLHFRYGWILLTDAGGWEHQQVPF